MEYYYYSYSIILTLLITFIFYKLTKTTKSPIDYPLLRMFPAILAHVLSNDLHTYATSVLAESNTNGTFFFRGPTGVSMDFLVTCDPANVNHIFTSNFSNYPKGDEFSAIFDVLGNGIFNADGESWRNQRKKAHSAVSQQKFKDFVARYSREKVENELVAFLNGVAEEGGVVDLQEVFFRLMFDMTCNLVFGDDPKCLSPELPTVPFARAMDDAMEAIFVRHVVPPPCWKIMRWLNIGTEKKLAAAHLTMKEFVTKSIQKNKASNNINQESLIMSYIGEHNNEYITDTCLNFMLAGRDTTASALSWFFYLLSKNPSVELKIIQELKLNQNEHTYLHAALCESLRLYPSIPFEHKMPVVADELPSGHWAPAGRKIMFSSYSMGRMEWVWGKDCLEYRPERWITEKGAIRHEPAYKFFAFNCGPRLCVGKDVAFTQMKTVAAAMISKFRIDGVEGHVVEPKLSVVLQMKNGWQVRVNKRTM